MYNVNTSLTDVSPITCSWDAMYNVNTSLTDVSPIKCSWDAMYNANKSPTDVFLIKFPWISHLLDKASLGYCVPDQTIP
jgi:hypothetical protein